VQLQRGASGMRAAIALARAQLSMLAALAKAREMVAEAARMRSAAGTRYSTSYLAPSTLPMLRYRCPAVSQLLVRGERFFPTLLRLLALCYSARSEGLLLPIVIESMCIIVSCLLRALQ
jgi:hypothetical protein